MATRKGCSPSPDDYGMKYVSMLKGRTDLGLPFYAQSRIWYLAALQHAARAASREKPSLLDCIDL